MREVAQTSHPFQASKRICDASPDDLPYSSSRRELGREQIIDSFSEAARIALEAEEKVKGLLADAGEDPTVGAVLPHITINRKGILQSFLRGEGVPPFSEYRMRGKMGSALVPVLNAYPMGECMIGMDHESWLKRVKTDLQLSPQQANIMDGIRAQKDFSLYYLMGRTLADLES